MIRLLTTAGWITLLSAKKVSEEKGILDRRVQKVASVRDD
jgi:hypothetical protein